MKGGVWLRITSQWEVWDYTQWRVVCDFTSHHNEKCETTFNEGWCVTLHHITMRSVRLYSMKGGVWLYITSQWDVWDYTQWRVVCDFASHHNEKCETILNEGWCVTLHHITMRSVRLHSMKGGVLLYITSQWEVWDYIQWRVVCYFTSHHNEKCETTFNEGWCVTLHHITMRSVRLYSMKGGVWLYITSQWDVWDYTQWRVVCDFTSHHNEKCETTFNEGWCVTLHHITMRSVRLHSMKGGVLLYITSQWEVWDYTRWRIAKSIVMAAWMLHGLRFGGKPGQETLGFRRKVAPAGDERYLVCAAGAAVRTGPDRFLLCVLQRVVVHVCVVLCVSWLSGCRSQCNGCMIVVVLCCHVRREMRVGNLKLQNAL